MSDFIFKTRSFLEKNCYPLLALFRRLVFGRSYRLIPLTKNRFALVDPEDYKWLIQYKWFLTSSAKARHYAATHAPGRNVRKQISMHRLIMNAPSHLFVDHRNRKPVDNRRFNLRLATPAQNTFNVPHKKRKNATSKYRGVSRDKKSSRYTVRIQALGRKIYLGTYPTEIEAAKAYDRAARLYHGQFATTNFK